MPLTPYEHTALKKIRAWQAQPPGPATRLFGKAAGPASQAVQSLVPAGVLRSVLTAAQNTASRISSRRALLQRAGVADLAELRQLPLQACDRLALHVRRRAVAAAGASGALLGVAGIAGLVIDVPALLVLALRTIQRVGLCYGEALEGEGRPLTVGVFALASANTMDEKQAALDVLRNAAGGDAVLEAAWRDGVERAAERELAKEAAVFSLNRLASQLSVHLGWRKAAGSVPILGAVVGGSVNAWYLHDLATVAQYVFQERRLAAGGNA